jgi:hypothetical protein
MTELLNKLREQVRAVLQLFGPRFALAGVIGLTSLVVAATVLFFFTSRVGVAQPVPFSHRFHVGTKQLSCVFCHSGVLKTERAGVPPVETCMLCHKRIIVTHPEIKKLRDYFDTGTPIPWVRINRLSEFAFFNHERHIRAGFDCGRCHGDVASMDRVRPPVKLNNMGFCVQCHRDEEYSHDCLICHR